MAKFAFIYHGGKKPDTAEEGARIMDAWMAWYGQMGSAVADGGAPFGPSQTVAKTGVTANGGANPAAGYTLVEAPDIDAAVAMAKGCPILTDGGSVEVAEALHM